MARSYFSYSVVRSDPTNLTTGGDSILTTLKNVNWEVKKLDSSNNEVSTSIYTGITGNTTIAGAAGVTDWNGLIEFWADAGQYVIKVTDPSSRIANKNIYWDSVSGQTGGIPGSTITSETITTTQIKDAEVKTADIDSSAVETAKIADAAITTAKIAPSGVTTEKINDAAITNAKIAPSGVTTEKINDAAITNAKIAPSGVTTDKISPGTIAQANMADGTYVPVGAIMQYAGTSAPTNWLFCDGTEKQISLYPALDAALGGASSPFGGRTNGAGGAGSSHFKLPDFRGRVPVGLDNMGSGAAGRVTSNAARGNTGGAQSYALASTEIPEHRHNIPALSGSTTASTTGNGAADRPYPAYGSTAGNAANSTYSINGYNAVISFGSSADGQHAHSIPSLSLTTVANNTGYWGGSSSTTLPHQNMQPYIAVHYIIRAA